ncbi:MAG: PAS domain-containing protein [Alphaproteobacteria bacterium]|nr:PAS domain-containing protein [Alphaproteobacteria bacterium]
MKHKNSHLLVGYWSRIRRGRDVPDQTDIDPRAIKRMLSYVFILDVEDPKRPVYRLAGTSLCERFGFELKGTGFLAHWEAQSGAALASLLKQALDLKQPICLTSIGASADCGMVELETVLAPVSFGPGKPTRFLGMIQIMSDATQLGGRPIAFQRLAASQLIREDEPMAAYSTLPPPPPPGPMLRSHPKAPHLRLVVSQDRPAVMRFDGEEIMERIFEVFSPGTFAS